MFGGANKRQIKAIIVMMTASVLLLAAVWSCRPEDLTDAGQSLQALPQPNLANLDSGSDFPLDERTRLEEQALSGQDRDRAQAYGRLGMLYHAYNLYDAAQVCYLNASLLTPEDSQWHYLAGSVFRLMGNPVAAEKALVETVRLDPENAFALVSLGELALQDNRLDQAGQHFEAAMALEGDLTAAFIGLGNVAMERGNFRLAVQRFQEALEREPSATVVHYLLGMAYRSLGDEQRAVSHLSQRGEGQPVLTDPLLSEIDLLRNDPEAMRIRGNQAAAAGRFGEALEYYRQALNHNPQDARIWINVGLCRYQLANLDAAVDAYRRVLANTDLPTLLAAAHYRIGDILEMQGNSQAYEHYLIALQHDPKDPSILFRSAETLRSAGRFEPALELYDQVLQARPGFDAARLGRALTLIRLGLWTKAKQELQIDIEISPTQPVFKHLLARLLAASPEQSVRDGVKALQLIEEVAPMDQSLEVAETHAMALAEVARFEEALSRQREAIAMAVEKGMSVERLQRNLLAYTRQKPIREPWVSKDPLFTRRNYLPGL